MAQWVKNPPVMRETQVQGLGWEDPLEEGMATPSSILAWRISWTEEPGGLQSMGSQKLDMTQRLNHIFQVVMASYEVSRIVRSIACCTDLVLIIAIKFNHPPPPPQKLHIQILLGISNQTLNKIETIPVPMEQSNKKKNTI